MALLQSVSNLSKSFGTRTLFRGISISFDDKQRVGLIGPNGAGKSTLLKILAGVEQPDDGELVTRRNLRLGYLGQQDVFADDETAESVLLDAAKHLPGEPHDRQVSADILLDKFGFTNASAPASQLSGGWKKRLAIARELIREPDFLLLDEPTNHLDLEGILLLENLLLAASFAVMIVSHDRSFLDRVTNRTVELSPVYKDGYLSVNVPYSQFVEKREEHLTAAASRQQSLASAVRDEVEWLRRGPKARGTKAKGRIDQAHEMIEDLADMKSRSAAAKVTTVDFAATDRRTRKLLTLEKVSKSFADRLLFENVNLILSPGSRLGLIGPNGCGKSTLIGIMTGRLSPDSGSVKRADALRVVTFHQDRSALDPQQPLRQALCDTGDSVVFDGRQQHISGWARRFLFRDEQLDLPVGQLSGGEQARVMIARMMLQPADVLILDEPTNDLDIPSLDVLEQSLASFAGALVLVTHDRYLLQRLSTELLGLDGNGRAHIVADTDQYLRWRDQSKAVLNGQKSGSKSSSTSRQVASDKVNGNSESIADADDAKSDDANAIKGQKKKLSYMEQRELTTIEAKIATAEESLEALRSAADKLDPAADWKERNSAYTAVESATAAVHQLYDRWQMLEERAAN